MDGDATLDDPPPRPQLPGYRLLRSLSQTNMSLVYLAEDMDLGRKVALKVLHPALAREPNFRSRFQHEVEVAAGLNHPNIIPIYRTGEAAGQLYLTMRYVEGDDLSALLGPERPLPPETTAFFLRQIASALSAAHRAGLVHRDVKPSNVLVDRATGHVYLCDFGIAKRITGERSLTTTRQFIGSVKYAAPEQIEHRPVDARTDVYALGALLFHCLTGRAPFEHTDHAAILYGQLNVPPPRVTSVRPELERQWDRIVARAMAKNPDDRYPSAHELSRAVTELVARRARHTRRRWVSARARRLTRATAGALSPATRSLPRRLVSVGTALALVVAGVFWATTAAAERRASLLARIPQELREGCDPADPSQGAESAFRCRQATVNLFSADSALERAYQDVLRESGAVRASGDCSTGRTGEHRYPATGEPRGRVACSMTGTTSSYAWTDLKAQALVRASRKDDESGRLRDAWVGWQRILPFPTADERELIDRFGDDSCVRAPAADLETFIDPVAGIRCASGGRTVSYYRFATLDDLRRSYRGKTPCGAAPTINSFLSVRLGTTGCVTRSVTQTLMDWTVEPQLVLASTEGIDAKSLGSWWVSKQSTPTRLAWAMAPDFPTPEERKLKALIPVPKGAVCMRPSPERVRADVPTATVVGVACGPTRGAREVYYYQFRDVTAMQRNYQGGGLMNGAACDEKTKGFTGEQSYDIDKKPAGRLRCGVNAQGRFLTWTDERLNIQTFAYGGADPKTFYNWWENDSGPNEE